MLNFAVCIFPMTSSRLKQNNVILAVQKISMHSVKCEGKKKCENRKRGVCIVCDVSGSSYTNTSTFLSRFECSIWQLFADRM